MHPKIYQHIRMSRSWKNACRSNQRMSTRTKKVAYTDADASYSRNMLQNLLQSRTKTRVPRVLKSTTGGWRPNWFRKWSRVTLRGQWTHYFGRSVSMTWQYSGRHDIRHLMLKTHGWMSKSRQRRLCLRSCGIVKLFLDTLQSCTDLLLKEIGVNSSSGTTMKYMDAFGVGSDEDYWLRHKHNYTSTHVK
jgi:hypothetical protein